MGEVGAEGKGGKREGQKDSLTTDGGRGACCPLGDGS